MVDTEMRWALSHAIDDHRFVCLSIACRSCGRRMRFIQHISCKVTNQHGSTNQTAGICMLPAFVGLIVIYHSVPESHQRLLSPASVEKMGG